MIARAFISLAGAVVLGVVSPAAPAQAAATSVRLPVFAPGLGNALRFAGYASAKVIHTADGGQVFGFAIDQHGDDGVLASAQTTSPQGQVRASVETFSQSSAQITKVLVSTHTMDDFVTEGIGFGDVGLVLHEHVVGSSVVRTFHVLDPVSGNAFTGTWTPPHRANFLFSQLADNQATATAAIFGFDLVGNPVLFSSDLATNTFGPEFKLDGGTFGGADQPQLAQDTATGEAVIATSPDGGTVGGQVPLIAIFNLSTGAMRSFSGIDIPPFHSGYVNGLAVDSATGIAATTTELDAAVEFYKLSDGSGTDTLLPGSGGNQFNTGEAVVSDRPHRLFLVAQPNGSVGPSGDSVVDVFNERGKLVKSITGLKAFGITPQLAVNPATRTGFISGPTQDAITEFTY